MNMIQVPSTLYYVHDPMCSWCWGFRPTWNNLRQQIADQLPQLSLEYIVGGLAADSDVEMPDSMKSTLQMTWQRIQTVIPETVFNYDFWQVCSPRRSTYPACRAVLAAKEQNAAAEEAMIFAIQQAYYLHARNPSNADVLLDCAQSIGLDRVAFEKVWLSEAIEKTLQSNLSTYHQLASYSGASGFPSMILACSSGHSGAREYINVPIDYIDASASLRFIKASLLATQ